LHDKEVITRLFLFWTIFYIGTCTFTVAGPKACDQLQVHMRARETVGSFKTALKTRLQSFV